MRGGYEKVVQKGTIFRNFSSKSAHFYSFLAHFLQFFSLFQEPPAYLIEKSVASWWICCAFAQTLAHFVLQSTHLRNTLRILSQNPPICARNLQFWLKFCAFCLSICTFAHEIRDFDWFFFAHFNIPQQSGQPTLFRHPKPAPQLAQKTRNFPKIQENSGPQLC